MLLPQVVTHAHILKLSNPYIFKPDVVIQLIFQTIDIYSIKKLQNIKGYTIRCKDMRNYKLRDSGHS